MGCSCLRACLVAASLAALPVAWLPASAAQLSDTPEAVSQALNRLTFGARPGEAERLRQLGMEEWLNRQLHPDTIDDAAVEARLTPLPAPPASADPKELRRFARRQIVALSANKVVRSVYSERQLQEVLVDFWFNHFNVYAGKGRVAQFLPQYERDAIRPYVFGHFRDLLGATAKSPAMLVYLDNWRSAAPDGNRDSGFGIRGSGLANPKRQRGLNENYGRELLELHTLGVTGGYTQDDVVAVARAFTGWTTDRNGGFRFVRALHDTSRKVVLGREVEGSGIDEGERVLDLLARHPSTAHHVAFKLAQRLVSDVPPPALVDRAAARFLETDGDLREVVRSIVTSSEFLSPEAREVKFKTPLELVVSALRATDANVGNARPLVRVLQELGEPLFLCQPPTGYRDTADGWMSAGGLVSRMNFATRLSSGNLPGTTLRANPGDPEALALRLGSPEFQRH